MCRELLSEGTIRCARHKGHTFVRLCQIYGQDHAPWTLDFMSPILHLIKLS